MQLNFPVFQPQSQESTMKSFYRLICRILIASMIFLPFSVNAGMIGTGQATASAQDLANRDKVRDFAARESVSGQLQAMGISSSTANERIAAMTQEEINTLAGKIDSLPAGAMSPAWGWTIGILIVAGIIYSVWGPGFKSRR
jgi:hypothetical protein